MADHRTETGEPRGARPVRVRTWDGERDLGADAVASLRGRLKGDLLFPGDPGYDAATLLWNGMIHKTPALVVRPAGVADVVACVDFARAHRIPIAAKGGGHNIAGTALADGGLTIDMSTLKRVEVDPRSRIARVQPGCLLRDVDRATQAHGLATVLGFFSETGVAGLTLGGGLGYLARRFGWTVDNLLQVEIVTADGQVRRAGRDQNADLFWAVRGGGGNFGVVTELVYRLHPVGPEITGGLRAYPAETREEARAALDAYRTLTERAPRELTVFCLLRRAPPAPFVPPDWHGRRVAAFMVCHSGEPDRAEADLAPLTALGEPVFDVVQRRPYVDQQSLLDATEPKGMHYYWKTEYVADLADGLLDTVAELSLANPAPLSMLGFLHIGGALNERPADDGAVGNRDARFALGAIGMWEPDDPHGDALMAWHRDAAARFAPFSTGGHYVNFETADDDAERTRAAYGANYDRLAAVKAKFDPDNLFRNNRNVPPRPTG